MMHGISVEDIYAIVRPTVLFNQTNKLNITELIDAETDPTKKLQDNGATPPVVNQQSSTHSPLEDT